MESDHKFGLKHALSEWKKSPGELQTQALAKEIRFAAQNGIDLKLKIPRSVLSKDAPPLSRSEFMQYSTGVEGNDFVFEIPSESTIAAGRAIRNKTYSLDVKKSGGYSHAVYLKGESGDIIGFSKEEISAIEPA